MAVTHVATGAAATANNASVTPAIPSGLQAGDLLYCVGVVRAPARTFSAPTGWSATTYATNTSTNGPRLFFSYARYTAGMSNPTFTAGGTSLTGADVIATILAFRGANPTGNPITAGTTYSSGSTTGTSIGPIPGVASPAGGYQLAIGGIADDINTPGALSGYTLLTSPESTLGNDAALIIYGRETPSATAAADVTIAAAPLVSQTRVGEQDVIAPTPAISLVQSTSGGTNSANITSYTVSAMNAGATAGNLLVASITVDKASGVFGTPTGWTKVAEQSGTNVSHALFSKTAAGGETAVTITWATAAPAGASIVMAEYKSNVGGTPSIGAYVTPPYSNTAVTSMAFDPPAGVAAGARAFITIGVDTSQTNWNPSITGWTRVQAFQDAGSSPGQALLERNTELAAGENPASVTVTTGLTTADEHGGTTFIMEPGTATGTQVRNLDGVNDSLTAPDSAALQATTGLTVAFWIKYAGSTTYGGIFSKGNSLYIETQATANQGDLAFVLNNLDTTAACYTPAGTRLPIGVWKYVVCRWASGGALTMDIFNTDGTAFTPQIVGNTYTGTITDNTDPLRMGEAYYTGGWVNARYSRVFYHNARLTDAQVTTLRTDPMNPPVAASGGYWLLDGTGATEGNQTGAVALTVNGATSVVDTEIPAVPGVVEPPPTPTSTPPSYRAGSLVTIPYNTKTNVTVNRPVGVQADDIIMLHYYIEDSNPTITAPDASWTEISYPVGTSGRLVDATSGQVTVQRAWWKRATASEPTSYTFTHSSAITEGGIMAFSGAINTGSPFEILNSAVQSAKTAQPPAISGTTGGENRLLIYVVGHYYFGNDTQGPTNFTEIYEIAGSNSGMNVSYKAQPLAGGTGNIAGVAAAPGTTSNFLTGLVALIPAYTGPQGALIATASAEAQIGPPEFERYGEITATASASASLTLTRIEQSQDVVASATASAAVGTTATVNVRNAVTATANAAPTVVSGVGAQVAATARATPTIGVDPLIKPGAVVSTGAASVVNGGVFRVERTVTATASAAPAVLTNTIQRRATLTAAANATTTTFPAGQAALVATAAAAPAVTTTTINRRGAVVAEAAAAPTIAGFFNAFKSLTATAAAAPTVAPVVTPVVVSTGRASAAVSGFQGASVPVTANGAASMSVAPSINARGVITFTARAAPAVNPLVRHEYALTAKAVAVVLSGGFFLHKLKKTLQLDFGISGTLSPLPERFSTVQIVADLTGVPTSITGMVANAEVDVSTTPSVLTLGPPGRFSVDVGASGKFSIITQLAEQVVTTVNAVGRLRAVQSLTTILENGLPALITSPVRTEPAPAPEPEPEPAPVPVYSRTFFNLRR